MLSAPRERTWYLSGVEEACAHIMDMAERAEESIVISLTDISCVDTKKLAKVGGSGKQRHQCFSQLLMIKRCLLVARLKLKH